MDVANPSYRDDPLMLLRQMSCMASVSSTADPVAEHRQLAVQRDEAYRQLLDRSGPVRRALLKRLYTMTELFAGTRDTPKHLNLLYRQRFREVALAVGARLVADGQLDSPQQIFGLCVADLESATGQPGHLRRIHQERVHFLGLLARRVKTFPALIDSRGRIVRPPLRASLPGQLQGVAMSPGVARGRVKCLHTAHDTSIEPGDILVAFTTDPGWTPLFVTAGAIVLEVGGLLQHGALVARELNKPCVAGISEVFSHLRDGQLVSVDGDHGIVSMIDAA
jgi:pyruvate,water dikinase